MSDQLTFDLEPLVRIPQEPTREEAWATFSAANPHIERMLVTYARDLLAMGHSRLSMRMLWERIRFEYASRTRGDSTAALNNNHAPFYAKALMEKYDDLAGVFETRSRDVAA